jgi:hypothetical protein
MTKRAPARRSGRAEEIEAIFSANYRAYQYQFVEFFIEHLTDVSRKFQGDLQAMIVLGIIGQMQLREARLAVQAGRSPLDLPLERVSITASRIADVTSIPRQTVRRKLIELEGRRWIARNSDGSYRLAVEDGQSVARDDLADVDARAMVRVSRLFRDLEKLVNASTAMSLGSGDDALGARTEHAGPPEV